MRSPPTSIVAERSGMRFISRRNSRWMPPREPCATGNDSPRVLQRAGRREGDGEPGTLLRERRDNHIPRGLPGSSARCKSRRSVSCGRYRSSVWNCESFRIAESLGRYKATGVCLGSSRRDFRRSVRSTHGNGTRSVEWERLCLLWCRPIRRRSRLCSQPGVYAKASLLGEEMPAARNAWELVAEWV